MSTELLERAPLLIRLLCERGELDVDDLQAIQGVILDFPGDIEEALISAALADEVTIADCLAQHHGLTWFSLREDEGDAPKQLLEVAPGQDAVSLGPILERLASVKEHLKNVPEQVCRDYKLAPIFEEDGVVHLACLEPADFAALEELRVRVRRPVLPHVCSLSVFQYMMRTMFGDRDSVKDIVLESNDEQQGVAQTSSADVDLQRNLGASKESQVMRIVNTILMQAIQVGASDIHLEPYEKSVRVRYRIDGHLREVTPPPPHLFAQAISRLKILAKMDIAERRVPQDGGIALKDGDKRVDLRASTVPTVYGEKVVLRVLEKGNIPERLEMLGFSEKQAADFLEAGESHHGLMFVTGPTGSGKSTTLYCCLNLVNDPHKNIVTVEDPVEYKFEGLNQVQVRANAGMTFAGALRAFLRQDPDVIMVGEVRDQETAQICMRAALTGHLVLSTLHTNSALQVVNRLVDMGIEPFLLGPALKLLEAQRLVRRLCSACKQPYELPADVAVRHGMEPGAQLWRPGEEENCDLCHGGGYKGRLGIYEVVCLSEELQEMVAHQASESELRKQARREGVDLLDDSARTKLLAGETSLDEVSDYIRVR